MEKDSSEFGEALGRVYADQHGLSCISVRLGSPRFDQGGDWDPEKPSNRISPRDTAQLFACCVDVEEVDAAMSSRATSRRTARLFRARFVSPGLRLGADRWLGRLTLRP